MKLITAVINKNDVGDVCKALTENGTEFTKLATTGGFLRKGNTTLMIGVEDGELEKNLDIIRKNCAEREENVPSFVYTGSGMPVFHSYPTKVKVGGAVVFVTDVICFEKM